MASDLWRTLRRVTVWAMVAGWVLDACLSATAGAPEWREVFGEEFDSGALDPAKWRVFPDPTQTRYQANC